MKDQHTRELHGYIFEIQSFSPENVQDADLLNQHLIRLTNIMARANTLMAEWNKKFREEKKQAYCNYELSMKAQGKKIIPSLAKDYIDSKCSETGYVFDLAERCSRLCSHTIDAIRTVVSSLKSEREFAKYN